MDLRLAGKRALVTGSSSGLGEAMVKLLAAEGVTVVVHGCNESRANAVAEPSAPKGGAPGSRLVVSQPTLELTRLLPRR